MEEQLSLDFLRVVENAAIAAARTMGFGTGTMPTRWPWKRCARPWIRWRLTERL